MIFPLTHPAPAPAPPHAQALTDARNRPLRDLRISLTNHCNLRCSYCMPQEAFKADHAFLPPHKLLNFEEIALLVQSFAALGVRKVKLTGGEPLTRPLLPRLVRMLHEVAPEVEVNLITNGILLAPLADQLKEAGLDRVAVSLDTLLPERFASLSGRGRQLDKVLAGIEAARRVGFRPVKINMVVIRGVNDDEIETMAATFRHPDTILRFIEYMDVGTLNGWQRSDVVPAAEILARLQAEVALEPVDRAYRGETAKRYRYRNGSGEIGLIASVSQPFCGDCSRLRLSADGKLYTCLFAKDGLDIKSVLRGPDGPKRIPDVLTQLWKGRRDQYSVERAGLPGSDTPAPAGNKQAPASSKIEMFYIGG